MDFKLHINDEIKTFTHFNELINAITQELAQWNNFGEGLKFLWVEKVDGNTATLGVHVNETVDTNDLFGRS